MRIFSALLLSLPLSLATLTAAHDAAACGACLGPPTEVTQVTGHKMILSISKTQTTLWDQITYSGNPSSFAWVLPIKGTVTIGLSSDALFQVLEQKTQVTVSAPPLNCPPLPSDCVFAPVPSVGGGVADNEGNSVNVLAQEVVGPYETVQLQSTDPSALKNWLATHNYNLPADVAPVVDAYIAEGFNFLALKLVPGQGISAMRPVRVTTPGASPVLPLRMVAGGTGAITPITLWVMGEGRYEPSNMPTFTIDESKLIWNYDTSSSNYASLQKSTFEGYQGKAWQTEAGEPSSMDQLHQQLQNVIQYDPDHGGYTADGDKSAQVVFLEDMEALFSGINSASFWTTRLHAELSRAALASDLTLQASTLQDPVKRFFVAQQTEGKAPACVSPCANSSDGSSSGGSCAMSDETSSSATLGGLLLGAAFTVSRLRRRRR